MRLRTLTILGLLVVVMIVSPVPSQAATIRGHSTHGRSSGGGHHYHGGYGYGFGFYSSYYYMPSYYPYGWYAGYYPAYLPDVAYIDTDVSPEDASVYVDGEYLGIADDFDGFPQYLSVSPGRHQITFKADGCRSVTRSVRVPRGAVLDFDFRMPKGNGSEERGEEVVVPDYRSGAPLGRDEGRQYEGDEDTRGRRGDQGDEDEGDVQERDEDDDQGAGEPAFIRLSVSPPDASVYLDGRLYGSAEHLSRLHGEMRLESGAHRFEVVRPGYRTMRREIQVRPGEHRTLELNLERSAPRPVAPR